MFDRAFVRADIECLNDGEGGALSFPQGYVVWSSGSACKWHFTLGKFASPVGFEGLDPTDMYQYSYGPVTTHCLPSTLSGAMLSLAAPKGIELSACVANGRDRNTDNNRDKTFGAALPLLLPTTSRRVFRLCPVRNSMITTAPGGPVSMRT